MKKQLAALALILSLPSAAWANDGNAATAASGQKGLFNLIYGENLCHGQWAFSAYYNKWDRRVQSDPELLEIDPIWTDWDMDVERLSVAIGYGLTDKVELSLMLPYWAYDGEKIDNGMEAKGFLNGRRFVGRIDQEGLGNLRLGAKFQLKRTDDYGVAINTFVDLPTGDDDESVVTGETGFGAGVAYSNSNGWVVNASYEVPGDSDFGDVSDEFRVGLGYHRDINDRVEWITELSGILYTESNGEHDAADITSGARFRVLEVDQWGFNAAVRVDLSDTSFDYTPIGGLIGVSYSPKNRWTFNVAKDGGKYNGQGTVKTEDGKIDCGPTCSAKYICGASTTVTAAPDNTPAGKSRFEKWSGDCGGTQEGIGITFDGDKSCTAHFIKLYDLKVEVENKLNPKNGTKPGQGNVDLKGPHGTTDCSKGCTMTFDAGSTLTLEAKPAPKSTFGGWKLDCSGTSGTTSLLLEKDSVCVATFVGPANYDVKVGVRGPGAGTVTVDPPVGNATCADDCTYRYEEGTTVNFGGTPGTVGYYDPKTKQVQSLESTFTGWSGDCSGSESKTSMVMNGDKTCVGHFDVPSLITSCYGVDEAGKGKKGGMVASFRASCDERVEVVKFPAAIAELSFDYLPTAKNGGRPRKLDLCEAVATLAKCPEVTACITGHEGGSADAAMARERARSVARFLGGQEKYSAYAGISGKYAVSEKCDTAPSKEGVSVVLEKN